MFLRVSTRQSAIYAGVAVGTVALWRLMTAPSGFSIFELTLFAAPGAVLALSAEWASHVLQPARVTRRRMLRAAIIGALALPPFIALGIAFLAAMTGASVVVIFVLGAWAALGGGFIVALLEWLWDAFTTRSPAPVHLALLHSSVARARHSRRREASPTRSLESQATTRQRLPGTRARRDA